MSEKKVARLENWCVTPLQFDPYTPPECQAHGLGGNVFDSAKFSDGDSITTSQLASLRTDGDNVIVTTRSGSEYLLGQVDPEYERAYPKARERVIKSYTR